MSSILAKDTPYAKEYEASQSRQVNNNYRIRRITSREAFRLMGVKEEDFDKLEGHISDTQLYKLAGNSICVPVMEDIFKRLVDGK